MQYAGSSGDYVPELQNAKFPSNFQYLNFVKKDGMKKKWSKKLC